MASDLLEYNRGRERWAAHLPLTHPVRVSERRAVMQPSNTPEEWRPVVGYEGIYEVSNHGRVRSVDRVVPCKDGHTQRWPGKLLKTSKFSKTDHRNVNLHRNGVGKSAAVHRLVMAAFVGPCPDGMNVCHNNGVADDNRLENLRYDTSSANNLDTVRHGKHEKASRSHCIRGHALRSPNLKPPTHGRRERACVACNRASAYVHRHPARRAAIQEVSDSYYAEIMAGHQSVNGKKVQR